METKIQALFKKPLAVLRVRPKARKPAKVKAVGMQGVKERACELLLRLCSHSDFTCGLEAEGRRRWAELWEGERRNAQNNE